MKLSTFFNQLRTFCSQFTTVTDMTVMIENDSQLYNFSEIKYDAERKLYIIVIENQPNQTGE